MANQAPKAITVEEAREMREQLLALRNPKFEKEAIPAELDGKADAIVPTGINIWMFAGANTTMIIALGVLYVGS